MHLTIPHYIIIIRYGIQILWGTGYGYRNAEERHLKSCTVHSQYKMLYYAKQLDSARLCRNSQSLSELSVHKSKPSLSNRCFFARKWQKKKLQNMAVGHKYKLVAKCSKCDHVIVGVI